MSARPPARAASRAATRSSSSRAATTGTPTRCSSRPARALATLGIPDSPGRAAGDDAPTRWSLPFNDLDAVRDAIERHGDEIACVIVEPVAGNMGCVPPAPGFLEGLREACDELRRAARVRRGHDGLPRRARRRAGALRRQARPDGARQDRRRRHAGRRVRRPRRRDGAPRAARRRSTRRARSRAIRSRWRPGSRCPGRTTTTSRSSRCRHVIISNEMIHDARIVPLDGRAHVSAGVRSWQGDSRGRWDGDTLVVDTTNFNGKTGFRGADENLHLVERFKRLDPNTLLYAVHRGRFRGVHAAVECRDPDDEEPTTAFRIRVPRGEPRAGQHPSRRAVSGKGSEA